MRVPVDWLREYVAVPGGRHRRPDRCRPVRSGSRKRACTVAGSLPLVVGRVLQRARAPEERQDDQLCSLDVGRGQWHRRTAVGRVAPTTSRSVTRRGDPSGRRPADVPRGR